MRFGQSALLAFSELHKPACAMAILRESILLSHFGNRVRSLLAEWGSRKLSSPPLLFPHCSRIVGHSEVERRKAPPESGTTSPVPDCNQRIR
jgi:hypothetical protein